MLISTYFWRREGTNGEEDDRKQGFVDCGEKYRSGSDARNMRRVGTECEDILSEHGSPGPVFDE